MARSATRPRIRSLAAVVAVAFLGGCVRVPDGVTPVARLDLERYLGTWYEIARLDHRFERGLTDVTARYARREGGGLDVVNRGYDPERAEWREAMGKAFRVSEDEPGRLKVSFFGPFYGGYNVIALDEQDYSWSMVAGPDRSYLWILARSPRLDPEVLDALVAQAGASGFAVEELIFVSHGRDGAVDESG